jgi:hypothetical protein
MAETLGSAYPLKAAACGQPATAGDVSRSPVHCQYAVSFAEPQPCLRVGESVSRPEAVRVLRGFGQAQIAAPHSFRVVGTSEGVRSSRPGNRGASGCDRCLECISDCLLACVIWMRCTVSKPASVDGELSAGLPWVSWCRITGF